MWCSQVPRWRCVLSLTRDGAAALLRYGTSAAVSVALAFAVSVGPDHWASTACDAIAINSAAAVVVATSGLALAAAMLGKAGWPGRAAGVFGCGVAATAVFLALEPQCLGGPLRHDGPDGAGHLVYACFGNAAAVGVAANSAAMAAAVAVFPALGVVCAVALARDRKMRGDFGFLVAPLSLCSSPPF